MVLIYVVSKMNKFGDSVVVHIWNAGKVSKVLERALLTETYNQIITDCLFRSFEESFLFELNWAKFLKYSRISINANPSKLVPSHA